MPGTLFSSKWQILLFTGRKVATMIGAIDIQIDSTVRAEGSAVKNSPVFFFQSFHEVSKSEMATPFFQRN